MKTRVLALFFVGYIMLFCVAATPVPPPPPDPWGIHLPAVLATRIFSFSLPLHREAFISKNLFRVNILKLMGLVSSFKTDLQNLNCTVTQSKLIRKSEMLFLHVLLIQLEEMRGAFREDMEQGCGPTHLIERKEFFVSQWIFSLPSPQRPSLYMWNGSSICVSHCTLLYSHSFMLRSSYCCPFKWPLVKMKSMQRWKRQRGQHEYDVMKWKWDGRLNSTWE